MSVDLLDAAAAGMDAQRAVLDVTARNVAAAEAAGPNGVYDRLVPEFHVVDDGDGEGDAVVRYAGTHSERGGGMLVEMIAVMNASRAYESDVALFGVGKTLAEKTIDAGRL